MADRPAKRSTRRRTKAMTPTRRKRIARVIALRAQGLNSTEIGKRLGLAPSTVRDYWNDPERKQARHRQRKYSVIGVSMPAGGTPIVEVQPKWKSGAPSTKGAKARGRQMRAVIGRYAGR